jgi:hypothetical protein
MIVISASKLQLPLYGSFSFTAASFDFKWTVDLLRTLEFPALGFVEIRISFVNRIPAFITGKGHNFRVWPRRLRIPFGDIVPVGDSEVFEIGINGVDRRVYAFYRQRS